MVAFSTYSAFKICDFNWFMDITIPLSHKDIKWIGHFIVVRGSSIGFPPFKIPNSEKTRGNQLEQSCRCSYRIMPFWLQCFITYLQSSYCHVICCFYVSTMSYPLCTLNVVCHYLTIFAITCHFPTTLKYHSFLKLAQNDVFDTHPSYWLLMTSYCLHMLPRSCWILCTKVSHSKLHRIDWKWLFSETEVCGDHILNIFYSAKNI